MDKVYKNLSIEVSGNEQSKILDEELSLFQSDVANALLDYIENKEGKEVILRLEEAKSFLATLSKEIENTFPQNNLASDLQSGDFDCAEDILKGINLYLGSSSIH